MTSTMQALYTARAETFTGIRLKAIAASLPHSCPALKAALHRPTRNGDAPRAYHLDNAEIRQQINQAIDAVFGADDLHHQALQGNISDFAAIDADQLHNLSAVVT